MSCCPVSFPIGVVIAAVDMIGFGNEIEGRGSRGACPTCRAAGK